MNQRVQSSQLFNAIPVPMFIVDNDVRILDSNAAADIAFGLTQRATRSRLCGETLHCLHSGPVCNSCVIRNAVSQCRQAVTTTQRPMKLEIDTGVEKGELELLISTSPLPEAGENAVLLIIEDITGISTLMASEPAAEVEYLYPDPDPCPAEGFRSTKRVA